MRFLAACLALAAPLLLAGCGFQPLYAERTGVARQLSGIAVETGGGRLSYQLGLSLRDELGSWEGETRYVLRTSEEISRDAQSVTLADIATRYELRLGVRYALYDAATGERVTGGGVVGRAAYDVPADPYAMIRAEQESEERVAQDAARQIALELARYFNDPETP